MVPRTAPEQPSRDGVEDVLFGTLAKGLAEPLFDGLTGDAALAQHGAYPVAPDAVMGEPAAGERRGEAFVVEDPPRAKAFDGVGDGIWRMARAL